MSAPVKLRPAADANDVDAWVHALVERAKAGDGEAFGLIYDRYFNMIYKFVYWRVGRNHALAEDIASETFLRALRRIGGFTWQGRDVGAWLVTIARNLTADHFKSGRHRLEVLTDDDSIAVRPATDAEADPEAAALAGVTNVELLRAMQQLTAPQRECLVLRFLHGMKVTEVAAAMDRKEPAIKALTYRAVQSLSDILQRNGFER